MNYKHGFHAGGFHDVFKHIVLIALIESLQRKDKPLCYLDTHAGIGIYDLTSEQANKTKEYETGIEKIIQQANPPELVKQFLYCVHEINNQRTHSKYSSLRYYPGSPLIAKFFARGKDRIVACELHPEEYQALRNTFAGEKQVAVHHVDGFHALKAFLPPPEKRGIVLIDPPYESTEDYTRIVHSVHSALKHWSGGVFAIWYPIKEKMITERFYRSLKTNLQQPILAIDLMIYPEIPNHLNGCGLAIINPPYEFDQKIKEIGPWLATTLGMNGAGHVNIYHP